MTALLDVNQLDAQPATGANVNTGVITLTFGSAVASGGFVEAMVSWFGLATMPTFTVTGTNGLTWVTDSAVNTVGGYGVALLSAQAPSGLVSGRTAIITCNQAPSEMYAIARSYTGVATSSAGQESKSATGITTASWTSGLSAALGGDSHLAGVGTNEQSGTVTDTILPFSWGRTTLQGNTNSGSTRDFMYRLDGTSGSTYQVQGTWSAAPFGGIALLTAYRDGATVEFARPDADVTDGSWVDNTGSNAFMYLAIAETTADDNNYIQSSASPSTADVAEINLSDITP